VEKLTPDIVLMDVSMPKRDGVAAAEEIGERWPDVRVIFITGTNAGTTLRRLTGRDYIRKGSPHAAPSVAAFYGSVSARVGALQRPDGCVDVTEKSVLGGSVRDGMLRLGARQVEQPRRARSSPRRIVSTDTERTDQERSIRSEAQMGNAPHRTYTLRQARHDHALWFSANAMKLHGTRIHEERAVSGGDAVFVVTSEKPPNHVRTWSVRLFTREVSGTIGPSASVGWGSHAQALAVATRLAAEETK